MKVTTKSICVGVLLAFGAAPAASAAIEVVNAGEEYAAAHPRPQARSRPAAGEFGATLDQVFGAGRWRKTSGYRTRAQEDALRRQGAGTVAPGHTSLHSLGDPAAPGAYDVVVERMSPATAAEKLRRAGGGFARVVAERAHGAQGPHLHVELVSTRPQPVRPAAGD